MSTQNIALTTQEQQQRRAKRAYLAGLNSTSLEALEAFHKMLGRAGRFNADKQTLSNKGSQGK